MKTLKFRSHYNSLDATKLIEHVDTTIPSETIQGETSTIADLLRKEMQGMVQTRKKVAFLDQEDLDKINQFYAPATDLTDLDDFKAHIKGLQNKMDHFEAERKEKERQRLQDESAPPKNDE